MDPASRVGIVDRRAYLEQQANDHGRQAVGVLPGAYPREVLWAVDLLPVELWGPPGATPSQSRLRVPAYVCGPVRHALQFAQAGGLRGLAGLIVPHTCDSLQGLRSLLGDLAPLGLPVLAYDQPHAPRAGAAGGGLWRGGVEAFRAQELSRFISSCEQVAGTRLDEERLARTIGGHERALSLARGLQRTGLGQRLGERQAMEILRSGEYLHLDDWTARLETVAAQRGGSSPLPATVGHGDSVPGQGARTPVLLSGLVPEPMELLDLIEEAGLTVVADDLLCLARRWPAPLDENRSPWVGSPRQRLLAREALLPPTPTCGSHPGRRARWLVEQVRASGAQAVILLMLKFCEPEAFALPALRAALRAQGIPLLVVEHELGGVAGEGIATRLEAFREQLETTPQTGGDA